MRQAYADLAPDEFRALGHELVDQIAALLGDLRDRRVAPDCSPAQVRASIGGGGLPEQGAAPREILRAAVDLLFAHSTFNGHPRFFGYITSSASPIGALSELLAASVNANCGAWALSPVATEIERQTVRWIAELIGYAPTCGGLLVSGGNMANMVCLFAAIRHQAGWNVRQDGIGGRARLVLYASTEVHTWLDKAADLSGLGLNALRAIPVDHRRAMRVDALRRQIAADRSAGYQPAVLIGTAGSVSTGAIDPLPDLAALSAEEEMWFHVDGAYGAPAAVLEDEPPGLRAVALADSVAIDPHKWLYAPIEAGCSLVRDPALLRDAFRFHPPYYRFDGTVEDPPTNYHEWGPQNTRGFRALKVWSTIRQAGREGYRRMIADDIALSRLMFDEATRHAEIEPLTQSLSIATFRYVPPDLRERGTETKVASYLNELNAAILAFLHARGRVYLSNAAIDGVYALRACIVNFRTEPEDARSAVFEAIAAGAELDARMRRQSTCRS